MIRANVLAQSLLVAIGVCLTTSVNAQVQPAPTPEAASPSALEPKAIEILKASSARLAAAHTMRFTAMVSYESPSRPGPPLVYTTRSDVTLQRPDKLRVITPGDGPASEFYYDGKAMVAFMPAENLVAVPEAPPESKPIITMDFKKHTSSVPLDMVLGRVVAGRWNLYVEGTVYPAWTSKPSNNYMITVNIGYVTESPLQRR